MRSALLDMHFKRNSQKRNYEQACNGTINYCRLMEGLQFLATKIFFYSFSLKWPIINSWCKKSHVKVYHSKIGLTIVETTFAHQEFLLLILMLPLKWNGNPTRLYSFEFICCFLYHPRGLLCRHKHRAMHQFYGN